MLFSEKQARMMKLWSHAVIIDTGITVEDEEQYKEASTDLDNAMQDWAKTVPISVYFKGVSEETLNEEAHGLKLHTGLLETAKTTKQIYTRGVNTNLFFVRHESL